MENWYEDNRSAVLEYPFDYERYIQERLREIQDLDERKFAKEVLLHGLGKVIQTMEARYQKLEQRVFEEVEIAANQFETVMTIIRRVHYDPINGTLFPVVQMDLEPDQLAEALSDEKTIFIRTIFLEADEGRQQEFLNVGSFPGRIGEREVRFTVRPAKRYRNAVERLYGIFQDNHIPWQTVNTGYLDKFYDIFAERSPDFGKGKEAGEGEKGVEEQLAAEAEIRFAGFKEYVRYERIPLWNIEYQPFHSKNFMVPCTDRMYYEHEFSLEERSKEDGYLVCSNQDILEIRHEEKKIVIKSWRETFEGWEILHIIQAPTVRSADYTAPLLTNHKRDSFIRRYSGRQGAPLMTKLDLFRRIMELDIRDFIQVTGYQICEGKEKGAILGGMNWFLQDELFPMAGRKLLLLQFEEKQPGHYLNGSMVRFVLSQLQLEISEYCCAGVIR